MLIHARPRAAAGQIAFSFEALPIVVGGYHGRAIGTAHIAYDGHGPWWVTQIEVSNPRRPGPDLYLPVSDPHWTAIRDGLSAWRADEIGEAIEQRLTAGEHMRIFDEHRPRPSLRRSPPPHARRSFRGAALFGLAGDALGTAVGTLAEVACIASFIGGFLVWGVPAVPPHAGAHAAPHAAIASLEQTDRHP